MKRDLYQITHVHELHSKQALEHETHEKARKTRNVGAFRVFRACFAPFVIQTLVHDCVTHVNS